MKAQFNLKIYNNVSLKGMTCHLEGVIGQPIVRLVLKGEHSGVEIELSAPELVVAAYRLASEQDGLMSFPKEEREK